ncbi:MAG: serine hydrolase domain-containing protein [Bryobacteraceae bacterium]|nr:serine hydrolase domain-containing protein [Bryobacteraceae bacterium]
MTTRRFWIALAALSAAAFAQPAIPDTPAGRVMGNWLESFNSGDKEKILAFMSVHEPERKAQVDETLGFRKQTGGFQLLRIRKSEPRDIEAIVKEVAGENTALMVLSVSEADPPVITRLGLRVLSPDEASDKPVQQLSETDALAGLAKEAQARAEKDAFAGAFAVARHGKILAQGAYGPANREKKIAADIDTQYRIGSMNKMFTAVAALQLVEAGKLSLDAPIGTYLKDYPNKDVAAKVTLRHLLSHTGGTGDIFGPEFDKHRLQLKTLDDYVKLYGTRALEFEPGAKWRYSNYGFLLAGVLIEKASGKSYYDYVREKVFKPAGMTRTDSLPETEHVEKRSVGYMKRGGQWLPNTDTLPFRGTSAGGGYSTVGDLVRFAQALESGKLLSKKMLQEATSPQGGKAGGPGYGFGFGSEKGGSYGHGGGAPGMNGDLKVFPKSGYVVAVLANLDPPAAGRLSEWFVNRMPQQ